MTPGDTAWKRFSFPAEVGFEAESITLLIGFQRAGGCFEVRNLNVEILGNALPLFRSGNRAWLDETAGDGRGGWTDQGPGRDGRVFLSRLRQQSYVAGVPFFLAELWNRQIPSIVVMKSRHNPAGSAGVEFAFPTPVKARYLYLLHALSYAKGSGVIGRILLQTPGGRREIPVTDGRDVGDWWGGQSGAERRGCAAGETAGRLCAGSVCDPLGASGGVGFRRLVSAGGRGDDLDSLRRDAVGAEV